MNDPTTTHFSTSFPLHHLEIDGILVTYENNPSFLAKHFSKADQKKFQDLLHQALIHPKKAYQSALNWKKEEKAIPELDNLLTYLHLRNRQVHKAETLIQESYKAYPDYFFAKINYADQCLRKKRVDQIPLIFSSFDLRKLFPDKKSFHVSEFRGFMTLMSHYHFFLKDLVSAKKYYQNAYEVDPTHPSVIFLEKIVHHQHFLKKFFHKILKLAHIS